MKRVHTALLVLISNALAVLPVDAAPGLPSPAFNILQALAANIATPLADGTACKPTSGGRVTDGTASWASKCSGLFVGPDPTAILGPSVTGQSYLANGQPDPVGTTTDMLFLNIVTRPGTIVGQTGMFIDFDSGEGAPLTAGLPNNTALIIASRQHPRSDGSAAPPTWNFNTNTLCAPGSKGSICMSFEQDYTNFDKPCAHIPDNCGIHAMQWHNYQTAYPISFDTYISADTAWQNAKVTVNGSTVTVTSGHPFSADTTTVWLGLTAPELDIYGNDATSTGGAPIHGGGRYRVVPGSFNAANGSLQLTTTPSQQGLGIVEVWNPHAVADVWLLSGDTVASDNDLHDTTSANNAMLFEGFHQTIINASADAAATFAILRAGQTINFNVFSGTMYYDGASKALKYNGAGGTALMVGDDNSVQGLGFVSADGGFISQNSRFGGAAPSNAFLDRTTSATGYQDSGTHSFASMLLSGVSPVGLQTDGTKNSQAQIKGTGYSINPAGNIDAVSFSAGGAGGASCNAPPTSAFLVINGIVVRC